MALSKFHLGILYEKYKGILGQKPSGPNVEIGLDQMLMKSPRECDIKAQQLYDESSIHFDQVSHLKGRMLALKHGAEVSGDNIQKL